MICHLIDSNLGTEYFSSIARECNNDRYPVMIGSIAPAGSLQKGMRSLDTPTFTLGVKSRWQYPLALWRLVRLLRQEKVRILHTHCFDPTWLGLIAAKLAGVSIVFTRHHSDHHIRIQKRWHILIDSLCAKHANQVIAVSEVTKQLMVEIEQVPATQITVVYNGMAPLRAPEPTRMEVIKRELNLKDDPICLMVARLHEEKGHRYLFDAIPDILAHCGSVRFLLAGNGPHQAQLQADVIRRGLGSVIDFLGHRQDIPELIKLSTLVVMPSLAESFGFAALEAMSLGKPVVAADTGGLPEVVADQETGLIVAQKDSKELASAIIRVIRNPELASALGNAGVKRAEAFNFVRMITGYEKVYDQVIELQNSKLGIVHGNNTTSSARS